ncbi:hypothetical protein CCP4SC76_2580001 [Gammaproteobacteria bacterium]
MAGVRSVLTPGGIQEINILREQGLYFFLGRSDKPGALPLQKWVAGEVIPSIRKTGQYALPGAKVEAIEPRVKALNLTSVAMRAAKAFGFKGNQAVLSADHAVRVITGESPLLLMGHTHLEASNQEVLLTQTEVGERLGVKVQEAVTSSPISGLTVYIFPLYIRELNTTCPE